MNETYDMFKTIMEENTDGHDVEIRYGEPQSQFPAVRIFAYRDFPVRGDMTCVTFGLSYADNSAWTEEKPELAIRVNSLDKMWIGFIGVFANLGQGGKSSCVPGQLFTMNFPFSEESEMKGMFVGGPADFPVNPISLPDRRIIIHNVHPVYMGETDLVTKDGWENFIQRVGKEALHDISRPDLSGGAESLIEREMRKMKAGLKSNVEDI